MIESLKSKILKLRKEGKTYDDIRKELGCSKATISYHCKRHGISNYDGTKLAPISSYKTPTEPNYEIY
jgi:uncharacterized protein YerC